MCVVGVAAMEHSEHTSDSVMSPKSSSCRLPNEGEKYQREVEQVMANIREYALCRHGNASVYEYFTLIWSAINKETVQFAIVRGQ